jgi:TonB-linked SusC/RagA family outer membrane protein
MVSLTLVRLGVASVLACLAASLDAQSAAPPETASHADPSHATVPAPRALRPPLERLVSLDERDARLEDVLRKIDQQAALGLSYTPLVVPLDRRVTIRVTRATVRDALAAVLRGTDVEPTVTSAGRVALVRRDSGPAARDSVEYGVVWGRVTDSTAAHPVRGAIVTVVGTTLSATANDSGYYAIQRVPAGAQMLVVRALGYQPARRALVVAPAAFTRQDVALALALTRLEEVVTTATGPQRRIELGNAITTINADSIQRVAPVKSVTDLLATRVPGLVLLHTSGAPGDPSRLRLRGLGSVYGGNDPIVIVDGVRIYAEQTGSRGGNRLSSIPNKGTNLATASSLGPSGLYGNGPTPVPSPLDEIDPNSIETIEVFKGPSAATLYGADAANGVIVITTKKGRPGPARWTVSASQGISDMPGRYPASYRNFAHSITGGGATRCVLQLDHGCAIDSTVAFQLLNDPEFSPFGQGHRTAASLGVSGGVAALSYAFTGSYADETGLLELPRRAARDFETTYGVAPYSWMRHPLRLEQVAGTSRLAAQLGQTGSVSLTTMVSRTAQQRASLENEIGLLMGTYYDSATNSYTNGDLASRSSLVPDFYQRVTASTVQFTNALGADWRARSWIALHADAGLNVASDHDERLAPRGFDIGDAYGIATGVDTLGEFDQGNGSTVQGTLNASAAISTALGRDVTLRTTVGANLTRTSSSILIGQGYDLVPGTSSLNGAHTIATSETHSAVTTYGYYVAPSLGFKNRLFVDPGIRVDGGSSYGTRAKGSILPKIQASWILSQEPFFPFKRIFNTVRLRAAYGKSSNLPGLADRVRTYTQSQKWIDGQAVTASQIQTIGNTALHPERVSEIEGGIDADLLDDRVSVEVTGYRKTTQDALMRTAVAPSAAYLPEFRNIGVVRNTGVEMTVGVEPLRTDLLTWSTHFNVSWNRNRVVRLGPGVAVDKNLGVVPGYPLGGRWARPIVAYGDANRDGAIQASEVLLGDSSIYMGGSLPNYTAALSTTLSLFRGTVAIDAGFSYEDGLTQQNAALSQITQLSRAANDPTAPAIDQAFLAVVQETPYGFIQTVSTLRLHSLSITYNAPRGVARRVGAQSLALALQGGNLWLHTNYRGLDPNVNGHAGSTVDPVADTGVLPTPRDWMLRLSLRY